MTMVALVPPALDTVAALATRAQPGWLWTVEATVAVVLVVGQLALLTALSVAIWRLSGTFRQLSAAVDRIREDVKPVTERAAALAGHLEGAASQVHEAVTEVTDTIQHANDVLRGAVETADARFHEFDAIVRVARDEAADVVVGAASVMRGVRGGVTAFRRRGAERRAAAPREEDADEAPRLPRRRRGGPRIRRQDEE
jgi:hypothetical protein